jgi:hypothetical protein
MVATAISTQLDFGRSRLLQTNNTRNAGANKQATKSALSGSNILALPLKGDPPPSPDPVPVLWGWTVAVEEYNVVVFTVEPPVGIMTLDEELSVLLETETGSTTVLVEVEVGDEET